MNSKQSWIMIVISTFFYFVHEVTAVGNIDIFIHHNTERFQTSLDFVQLLSKFFLHSFLAAGRRFSSAPSKLLKLNPQQCTIHIIVILERMLNESTLICVLFYSGAGDHDVWPGRLIRLIRRERGALRYVIGCACNSCIPGLQTFSQQMGRNLQIRYKQPVYCYDYHFF